MWCQIGVKPIPQRSKATVYLDFLVQRLHRMQTAYSPPSIFQNGADGLHKWISVLYRAGHSSFQSIRSYRHKFLNSDFFWIQYCSGSNIFPYCGPLGDSYHCVYHIIATLKIPTCGVHFITVNGKMILDGYALLWDSKKYRFWWTGIYTLNRRREYQPADR